MTAHTAEPGRARLLVPQLGAASSPSHLVKVHHRQATAQGGGWHTEFLSPSGGPGL